MISTRYLVALLAALAVGLTMAMTGCAGTPQGGGSGGSYLREAPAADSQRRLRPVAALRSLQRR